MKTKLRVAFILAILISMAGTVNTADAATVSYTVDGTNVSFDVGEGTDNYHVKTDGLYINNVKKVNSTNRAVITSGASKGKTANYVVLISQFPTVNILNLTVDANCAIEFDVETTLKVKGTITNNGIIYGKHGVGGAGGTKASIDKEAGNGGNGGHATSFTLNSTNLTNNGLILGGSGGGGGGGGGGGTFGAWRNYTYRSGGNGGNGGDAGSLSVNTNVLTMVNGEIKGGSGGTPDGEVLVLKWFIMMMVAPQRKVVAPQEGREPLNHLL